MPRLVWGLFKEGFKTLDSSNLGLSLLLSPKNPNPSLILVCGGGCCSSCSLLLILLFLSVLSISILPYCFFNRKRSCTRGDLLYLDMAAIAPSSDRILVDSTHLGITLSLFLFFCFLSRFLFFFFLVFLISCI